VGQGRVDEREDEGIVFGVARSEPRPKSASAGANPGRFKAPETIPSSSGHQKVRIVFGVARNKVSKDSLLITGEFFGAKKLRTSQGVNQNSSLRSSNSDLLERESAVLVFWPKIPKVLRKLSLNLRILRGKDSLWKRLFLKD